MNAYRIDRTYVSTQEGSLYQSADASAAVAAALRAAAPGLPLVLKVGLFDDRDQAEAFVVAISGVATAISTTNAIATVVLGVDGRPLFNGDRRGIGGRAIGRRCLAELAMLKNVIDQAGARLQLIAVGGVATASDVEDRVAAGGTSRPDRNRRNAESVRRRRNPARARRSARGSSHRILA
jgi:dihydroorotate dehydrogenase